MPDLFRRAIQRIMADEPRRAVTAPDPLPEQPESYGWLRRPELDRAGNEAWERPDGRVLQAAPRSPARVAEPARRSG